MINIDKVLAELELESTEVTKIYSEEFSDGYKACLWDLGLIVKEHREEQFKEMKQFEYEIMYAGSAFVGETILNERGKDGWELVFMDEHKSI